MIAQTPNSAYYLPVGGLALVSDAAPVMHAGRAVDAHRDCRPIFRADVENSFSDQNSIGLDTDGIVERYIFPQGFKQSRQPGVTEKKRLTTMKRDRKRALLRRRQVAKGECNCKSCFVRDPFGHGSPTRVSHVVNVAIATVDVAAARDFDENGIDRDHVPDALNFIDGLSIVPMVGPVVSAS